MSNSPGLDGNGGRTEPRHEPIGVFSTCEKCGRPLADSSADDWYGFDAGLQVPRSTDTPTATQPTEEPE
jgi:hypothetical protein